MRRVSLPPTPGRTIGPGKDSLIVQEQTNSFIPSVGIFGDRGVSSSTINGEQVLREQQVLIAVNIE